MRNQHKIWVRDRKSEAYSNALKHLFRLTNKRSSILANGQAVLNQGHQKEWFDDYISTIEALSAISIYSRHEFIENIASHAVNLRTEMEKIISGNKLDESPLFDVSKFIELAEELEDEVTLAAVRDLRLTNGSS